MANRIVQVTQYGWKHAGEIAKASNYSSIGRFKVFADILICYYKYKMWSNQYLKERFWTLPLAERERIGSLYKEQGIIRDAWQEDFRNNRKFFLKFSHKKYELAAYREKRNKAYSARYNAGPGLLVEYDVNISRQHYLNGSIKIGKNVLLAKHVFIDYSGDVDIKDDVQLTNGVIIETHHHTFHTDWKQPRSIVTPTKLIIEEGAVIGSRAIIMPSCHYIGKYARVGAGAVVTHDVPDYAIALGIPAKVVRLNQ